MGSFYWVLEDQLTKGNVRKNGKYVKGKVDLMFGSNPFCRMVRN